MPVTETCVVGGSTTDGSFSVRISKCPCLSNRAAESESKSEWAKFTDSDRLRASSYSRFKEIAMLIN